MKIAIGNEIMSTRLDDETALLNGISGRYYSLNRTGTRVWELLKEHGETEKVFNIIFQEYDVDRAVLRKDYDCLVSRFAEAGLVDFI